MRTAAQAAYDDVASDMYANDPRALSALVSEHGVQVRRFPEEILEAGAKAAMELITDIRTNGDALTKEVAESFVAAFNLLRTAHRRHRHAVPRGAREVLQAVAKLGGDARPKRPGSDPGPFSLLSQ